MTTPTPAPEKPGLLARWRAARGRVKATFKAYTKTWISILMVLWIGEWLLWFAAIWFGLPIGDWLTRWGLTISDDAQLTAMLGVSLALTQVTKPPRLVITSVATPFVARRMRRRRERAAATQD